MEKEFFFSLPFFERALTLATIKHAGQVDKGGRPYIMHVIRVMQGVEDDDEKIIALLHDLIEDTDFTLDDLKEYEFLDEIIDGVSLLTRDPEAGYMKYIENLSNNKKARNVKLSDLKDNQDHTRLKNPMTEEGQIRLEKYRAAEAYIRKIIKKEEKDKDKIGGKNE
ncbi:MAG: hypothetical protein GX829_09525 [Clostridium sp.]|nr:hypothetical protein [Clostridium sp.]